MIKIFHEAPKSIFKSMQMFTNGDYILVHLLEEDPEYLRLAVQSQVEGREIILDNSIFELEVAFNADKFAHWIKYLTPDWYIIPDALEDSASTIVQAEKWFDKYDNLPGQKIGVIQGKNYEELALCYQFLDKVLNVSKIAISFDYNYYRQSFPSPNKHISWTMGRVKLIGDLVKDGILNQNKKHHLLGMSLPVEGKFYKDYNFIDSVDTSNPVVHAIKGIRYKKNFGLLQKESQKLVELINLPASDIDVELLEYNIFEFKSYWNGK